MKKFLTILFLVVVNLITLWLICIGTIYYFGLIVAPIGTENSNDFVGLATIKAIIVAVIYSIGMLILNYLILKKRTANKNPLLVSTLIILVGLMIYAPIFMNARNSFLNYMTGTTQLRHFIDKPTIKVAEIIKSRNDTVKIANLSEFLDDIGRFKYESSIWKYAISYKIVLIRQNNSRDSIMMTKDYSIAEYKGRFFRPDSAVMTKYIKE